MKRSLIFTAAVVLSTMIISCVPVKAPVTSFKKYEVRNVNLTSSEFDFIFETENPNDIPLDIKDVEYKLYLEGSEFFSGKSAGFNLSAKDKKLVTIPITINYMSALRSVASAATSLISGSKKLKYKIEGNLVIESLGASARTPFGAEGDLILIN